MDRTNKRRVSAFAGCLVACLAQSAAVLAQPASARTKLPAPASPRSAQAHSSGEAGIVELPGEKEFNQCRKLPAGKRIVKLNFKPDSEISDVVAWISSISCRGILIAGPPILGKKVTILSPQLITPEEAYSLFLGALDSVGLTVEPMGKFLRVIETSRVRFSPMPLYKSGEQPPASGL